MHKRSIILTCLSIFVAAAMLAGCAGAPAAPTQQNFKAPVVTLDSMEVAHAFGYWYFSKKVQPTKGKPDNVGAPLELAFIFNVENPNEYPVEDVIVEVMNSNVQAEPYTLDWLQGKRKTSASMQMRFKKAGHKDDTENLRIMVLYTCNGKQHRSEEIRLPITMKSMFEMKDSSIFDDWE